MFTELTEELLDLSVHESGYRNALYAQTQNPGLLVQRLVVQPDLLQVVLELALCRMRPRREARWGR